MTQVFYGDPLNTSLFYNSANIFQKFEVQKNSENCYLELKNLVQKIQSNDETASESNFNLIKSLHNL